MAPRPFVGSPAYYAAAALAARAALALAGAGAPLLWRPEVSTPFNGLLGVREGLRMLQLGLSPYAGGGCHAPPLVLALHAAAGAAAARVGGASAAALAAAAPNIAADAVAALALWRLGKVLYRGRDAAEHGALCAAAEERRKRRCVWLLVLYLLLLTTQHIHPCLHSPSRTHIPTHRNAGLLLSPAGLAAAYLWNPLALLATLAGATTPLENAAVMAALIGGAARNAPLAAAGVAAAAYVGLQPLLLAVSASGVALWYALAVYRRALAAQGGGRFLAMLLSTLPFFHKPVSSSSPPSSSS